MTLCLPQDFSHAKEMYRGEWKEIHHKKTVAICGQNSCEGVSLLLCIPCYIGNKTNNNPYPWEVLCPQKQSPPGCKNLPAFA